MVEGILLIGLIIIAGFVAFYIQEKYSISYILPLVLLGILIGPVLNVVDVSKSSLIRKIYPFMSSLALILLLFDGGISFNIMNILKNVSKHLIYSITVFLCSLLLIPLFMLYFSFDFWTSLILSFTVGGTSSAVVLSLISGSKKATEKTKTLLTVESVLSDSLVIIAVIFALKFLTTGTLDIGGSIKDLLGTLVLSFILGGVAAYGWALLLSKIETHQFEYILTLSLLFIIYSLAESIQLNGGLTVFIFGLVFGNLKKLEHNLIIHTPISLKDEKIKEIQYEIGFFVKTFFFVYMGLLYPLSQLTLPLISFSFLFIAINMAIRYIIAKMLLNEFGYDMGYIISAIPRGLAAAVVVGILYQLNINILPQNIESIVFTIIIATNIASTVLFTILNK